MTLHKAVVTDVKAPRAPKLVAPNRFACWADRKLSARTLPVRCSASGMMP